MKKLIYILPVAALLLFGSCKKILEPSPEFNIDATKPLESLTQAEFVTKGMYSALRSAQLYSSNNDALSAYAALPDIMSDNLIETFASLGNQRRYSEWSYTSDEGNNYAMWVTSYNVIGRTNLILRDIDKFASVDQQKVNRLKGQALALRAHMHFELLRYYAGSYLRNSDTLAVPYIKVFDTEFKNKPARNTVKECYDNILGDLTTAKTLLSDVDQPVNIGDSKPFIDVNAVNAMLARVNFYAGSYADAITAANNAITANGLTSKANFPAIWTDETTAEVYWNITFTSAAEGQPYDGVYFNTRNSIIYRPSADIIALFNPATDVRYASYFATQAGTTFVAKYLGKNADGAANWKAYRAGEMYLILAEANYRLTNEPAARIALNALRSARITGFVAGTETGTALFNAIQTERRKEMAFEADRFFTLKRLGRLPITRSACGAAGNSPSSICSLSSASRAWNLPIPFQEIQVNSNLVQNPGY